MNNRMKKEKIKFLIKITNNTRLLRYIVRNYFVFFSFFFPFKCSTTCGPGTRTRSATCVTQGPTCNLAEKPITQDACDLGPCTTKSPQTNAISTRIESSQWLYTEWSEEVRNIIIIL